VIFLAVTVLAAPIRTERGKSAKSEKSGKSTKSEKSEKSGKSGKSSKDSACSEFDHYQDRCEEDERCLWNANGEGTAKTGKSKKGKETKNQCESDPDWVAPTTTTTTTEAPGFEAAESEAQNVQSANDVFYVPTAQLGL
jgi:hypothetical protein